MRSCEPSVVRCRLMSSLARVIAVEKPMQYSVPWTSLSIVLGMATSGTPCVVERLGEAQRVVAADGDEVVEAHGLDVLEHDRREVVAVLADRASASARSATRWAGSGSRFILRGLVREVCSQVPAGAVDGARGDAVERHDVLVVERGARPLVGQALPAATDAADLEAQLGRAIRDALDDAVEAGDVAAPGEDADPAWPGHVACPLWRRACPAGAGRWRRGVREPMVAPHGDGYDGA